MYVIRPIRQEDHAAFVKMAQSASIGITNMPKNPDLLNLKVKQSLASFEKKVEAPQNELYLFVLENSSTKEVGGVAGFYSKTGVDSPEYFFGIEALRPARFHPAVPIEISILKPLCLQDNPSEICSLFLSHAFRQSGLGRLLSLSRFLFLAAFPQRFCDTVTALMRGYFDAQSQSPFWDGVGRQFFDVDFPTLLRLREEGEAFVRHILPDYPLYLRLLTREAQYSVGRVHANTLPALEILYKEGFTEMKQVDFFDGGPRISAPSASIRTIRESRIATVASLVPSLEEKPLYLISNERLDFRATLSPLQQQSPETILLPSQVAEALEIQAGERIRYVAVR